MEVFFMAQQTNDLILQKQIDAGTTGRQKGHQFEKKLSEEINKHSTSTLYPNDKIVNKKYLYNGKPDLYLISYIAKKKGITFNKVKCWWTGALATSGDGDILLDENGNKVTHCKSDIIIDFYTKNGIKRIGVSVKSCNKSTPTNDQMFFTTARAFCKLLNDNGITVSEEATKGLQMFCGDAGFRPSDLLSKEELSKRTSEDRRYFWEELDESVKKEWETIFKKHQNDISDLLFRKAYKNDPFPPEFLIHQTIKYEDYNNCQFAIFTIEEIIVESAKYCGFVLVPYQIKKGTYKNDNATHYAPRFGFIQFQRGGQKQHPTQLQFNLKAGYFNHIGEVFSLKK